MIERCSKRRMILAIALLGLASAIIIILESSHLRAHEVDIHESHPILKEIPLAEKCWTREEVSILEPCHHCTKEEILNHKPVVCVAKGFKEKIKCETSGNVTYRACHQVAWVEERRFWIFEAVMFVSGCISASFVFLRQKQLDHIVYKRIQKQIATGV
eukprot:TRINITY_DN23552_c0_g1_i1.p1 TRINITY_DN23552_c0_g1~~TRINITY_DN23552_c0_g1_i1.p1  ORF type:complete len:158 (-),score=14.11 TRINITY_DN23552_c0_g1_i1:261-734(-)